MTKKYLGSSSGLTLVTDAGTAFVSSKFNSGHMVGDIKLATLSDTDDTDVTGSELIANYDFSTTGNWTLESGWAITGGKLVDSAISGGSATSDQFSMTGGKTYVLSFQVTGSGGNPTLFIRKNGVIITQRQVPDDPSDGFYSLTFTVSATGSDYDIRVTAGNFLGSFDFISVRLAEEDRSVNGNGLQVFGTVTKTAVATGADLVAYSGFSTSNYLEQPYNSDLDFGTGDFCVMGWIKNNAGIFDAILHRSAGSGGIYFRIKDVGQLELFATNSYTFSSVISGNDVVNNNQWNHVVAMRNNGVVSLYVNGNLDASTTHTNDITFSGAVTRFGNRVDGGDVFGGSLALFRISATAPTAEQIKKIYEDEKVLFQDGAQATLYGTSDSVVALDFDSDEQLLRVGTSAGRSDFSGLRRVSNTTTAVTTAISSSNGMVVEQ